MSEVVFLIQEAPEGGFSARALGHSIFTEAETWDDLQEAVRDAVRCQFEPKDLPTVLDLHYVRDEVTGV